MKIRISRVIQECTVCKHEDEVFTQGYILYIIIEINIIYFLVCEPSLMCQIGGELLQNKLNSPTVYNSWDCEEAERGDQQAGQALQVAQHLIAILRT